MEADRVSAIVNYFNDDGYIDFMLKNGKRAANLIKKNAMKIGSEADAYIRAELNGDKPTKLSHESEMAIKGWEQYKKDHPLKKPETVERLLHEGLGFTGEIDFLDGEELIDLKVATEVRKSYFVQLGGYIILLELNGYKVSKATILRLDKTVGGYETVSTTRIQELKNLFLSNLNLVRFWRGDYDREYFASYS